MSGTDVLYLNTPGMDIVVLSTTEAVFDLLDQRSAIYSDKVKHFHANTSPSIIHPFFISQVSPWSSCRFLKKVALYKSC